MRRKLILLLIICQLLVLVFMAAKREYIRAYGTEVYLSTAPVDPSDPLRGDFVRLRYAMSSVNPARMRGAVEQHRNDKDYPVYAVLKSDAGDIHVLDYLSDEKPAQQELFIKGYISDDWRLIGWNGRGIGVRYGIEQYFVEQGRGLEMEKKLGQRNEMQLPMEMRVAIGADGTAVIKDYRWSPLGIKLEMLRVSTRALNPQATPLDQPLSPKIRITLKNASTQTLTLADPGNHCGFRLIPVEWATQDYPAAHTSCDTSELNKSALIDLQPEQEYAVELDLSAPRWHVLSDGKAQEVGALAAQEMFRIVYRSPDNVMSSDDHNIWHGELPSQAFNASGNID